MVQPIVIRGRRDVVDLVNQGVIGQPRFWIVLIAIGGTFIDAYDFTNLGIGAIQLREFFGLGTTLLVLTIVPVLGLVITLSIPWKPVGADVGAEDFADAPAAQPS